MKRRIFLKNAAALVAAPAIVKAETLMPIYVPPQRIVTLHDGCYLDNIAALFNVTRYSFLEGDASLKARTLAAMDKQRWFVGQRNAEELEKYLSSGRLQR